MISPEPQALQEQVRDLHRQGTPWLPAGLGSRLHWGPPVAPESLVLSCRRLNRILEHNPGDFTVSVEAGTPLAELQACLASQNQWLPLDWPCSSGPAGEASGSIEASGSVGGLVARGLAGGYRQRYLGVRDQLIGIGLIRSDGVLAHAGGKVVKNVAGYDLMRLFTGSWGSLGLITELTLRTLPLPPQRRGLWLAGSLAELDALSRWLLASSLSPERLDWWSAPLVEQAPIAAPPGPQPRLLLSLASVGEQTLSEQIACITEKAHGFGLSRWQELSSAELERLLITARGPQPPQGEGWLLRLGVSSSQVASLLASRCLRGLPAVIGAGGGLGYAWASAAELPDYRVEELRRRCSELGGYLTVLQQPAGGAIPAWLDAPSRPLIEAIKRQFDPKQQLARGRLPGVQPPQQLQG